MVQMQRDKVITMFFEQSFAQMESVCVSVEPGISFIYIYRKDFVDHAIKISFYKRKEKKNNRIRNKNLNIAGHFVKKREIFF